MSEMLSRKVGEMEYDGLIADVTPQVEVRGKTIAALAKETELKRGTVFGKNADGKLVVLGTSEATLTADCILCDDITVGTDDAIATVYTAGCFNTNKITVANGYTMTEEDYDNLRKYNIVFKAASMEDVRNRNSF